MNKTEHQVRKTRQRGALLLETAAGGALLAIAFLLVLRLVGWVAIDRRDADRRQVAVELASNVLERLSAQPAESWRSRTDPVETIQPECGRLLVGGSVEVSVEDADPPGLKRVCVIVRWPGAAAPQRLTAWISSRGRTP